MISAVLTNKGYTILDNDDYIWAKEFNWHNSHGYAVRDTRVKGKYKRYWLHREVNKTPKKMFTDHINGNKLNNRKENLRIVAGSQNTANTYKRSHNRCGYKGVYKSSKNRWKVTLTFKRTRYRPGSFEFKEEAAKAYNKAALKYFEEYARLNILEDENEILNSSNFNSQSSES